MQQPDEYRKSNNLFEQDFSSAGANKAGRAGNSGRYS